ncbi:MAG: hypothetical protein HY788_09495 [Deltaproteobacteria bacterium]|nr:hypothetical protein [Deltaproteobacteria bacterium]
MPETAHIEALSPSRLHLLLKGYHAAGVSGKIDLCRRFSEIKKTESMWPAGRASRYKGG